MNAKVDSTKVAQMSRAVTVGGGDLKWATVTLDDHTSAVIVFRSDAEGSRRPREPHRRKGCSCSTRSLQVSKTSARVRAGRVSNVVGANGCKATTERGK